MSRADAYAKFVYGSKYMVDNADYDVDDMIDYNSNEYAYCNNNCMDCTLQCPYQEY